MPLPVGRILLLALLLLGGVAFVYGTVSGHEFVNYDDDRYVTANRRVLEGLSVDNARWAFRTRWASNWHPLTWISHMSDVSWFGTEAGPMHVVNAVWHALAGLFVFLFFALSTRRIVPAFFVAVFFAWHPLRVESVAWVAERKDVLSGALAALTLTLYALYARRPSALRYVLVLLAFAAGLMAKPMLVTLPFLLLLLDFWPFARARLGRVLLEKLPLLALAAAASWKTMLAQRASGATDLLEVELPMRLLNGLATIGIYLRQTLFPRDLACFYPHAAAVEDDPSAALMTPAIWGGVLALCGLLAGLALWRRRAYVLVGWLWMLGMLVPVVGLVQVGSQAHADRYTYLPLLGFTTLLVYFGADVARTRPKLRGPLLGLGAAAALWLASSARGQVDTWRDSRALWTQALAATNQNYLAHNNLGRLDATEGRLEEARAHFEASIRYHPGTPPHDPLAATAHYNLGGVLLQLGEVEAGIAALQRTIELQPDYPRVHAQLGRVESQLGRDRRAIPLLERAIELQPKDVEAINDLAWILATSRQRALRDGERALELAKENNRRTGSSQPTFIETLAAAQAELGNFETAIEWQEQVAEALGPEASVEARKRLRQYRRGKPAIKNP